MQNFKVLLFLLFFVSSCTLIDKGLLKIAVLSSGHCIQNIQFKNTLIHKIKITNKNNELNAKPSDCLAKNEKTFGHSIIFNLTQELNKHSKLKFELFPIEYKELNFKIDTKALTDTFEFINKNKIHIVIMDDILITNQELKINPDQNTFIIAPPIVKNRVNGKNKVFPYDYIKSEDTLGYNFILKKENHTNLYLLDSIFEYYKDSVFFLMDETEIKEDLVITYKKSMPFLMPKIFKNCLQEKLLYTKDDYISCFKSLTNPAYNSTSIHQYGYFIE